MLDCSERLLGLHVEKLNRTVLKSARNHRLEGVGNDLPNWTVEILTPLHIHFDVVEKSDRSVVVANNELRLLSVQPRATSHLSLGSVIRHSKFFL